jgi:hypothetical protein
MTANFSALDLETINVAHEAIVEALRSKCCEWEQGADDAVAEGRLSSAVMMREWAFAADVLATFVGCEFSKLFSDTFASRLNWSSTRSLEDQILDALALEVASSQEEPEMVSF